MNTRENRSNISGRQSLIRTIHVGVGGRGAWPLKLFRQHPDRWQPVALVDVNAQTLDAARQTAGLDAHACYASLEEALAGAGREAEGVVVITPSALHGRFVRQALEAGKHVLVEKPLVHSLAEAQALVALAEAHECRLVVAQNYRLRPVSKALRAVLAELPYGVPGYATFVHHRRRPDPLAFTMRHSMLVEMSVHHFDDFRFVFDAEPVAITAQSFNPPWSRYPGEAAVQALIEWDLPGCPGFTLAYTGTFTSATNALQWRIECAEAAVVWEGQRIVALSAGQAEPQEIALPHDEHSSEQQVADAWWEYIVRGTEPSISGRRNLGTIRMIEAAIRSSETGTRVRLADLAG